jgi:hypothetical protein
MKILAHSKNGMLKVGTDNEKGNYNWYFLDEKISALFSLADGIEIEIVSEERKDGKYLISISSKDGVLIIPPTLPKVSREDVIIRQSVLKAIGSAMPTLTGQVDPNNIWDFMIIGYEKLLKKVTE